MTIENLILTGTGAANGSGTSVANRIVGNAGNNVLSGYGGDDVLDAGGGGRDTLYGGTGHDTYIVSSAATVPFEGADQGVDLVRSSVSFALGTFFENLELVGGAALDGTGNSFDNRLTGNAGRNTLDGKIGADVMAGRPGDDTYMVDNARDQVLEAQGQGRDTVIASLSYVLAAGQEIETLQLAKGAKAFDLTGNAFANGLVGNDGANTLDGLDGADVLTGRAGADTFVFSTKLGAGNVDRIADFLAKDDGFRLDDAIFKGMRTGMLTASAFKVLDNAKIDADDRILYRQKTGELFYDADGAGKAAAMAFAVLDKKAAITHLDFLIA